jgi:hypothetical protein
VTGAPVRIVPGPTLSLAVSELPAEEFSEDVLSARLEDEGWTAALAWAHFEAIEALFRGGPVLPLRLATVFSSAQRGITMLAAHHDRLSEALVQVTGSAQWTVRVTARSPRGTNPESSDSGTGYLRAVAARRDEAMARHAADKVAATELHRALADVSVSSELDTTSVPNQLLSGVYLVRTEEKDRFMDAVSQARAQSDALVVDVRGPLAPYSFVPRLEDAA